MHKWSVGRLDFSLPEQFKLKGRSQSIYHVQVETIPLQGRSAQELWEQRVNQVRTKHLSAGYGLDTFRVTEISPGFSAVFYRANKSMPIAITVEAFKTVPRNILTMKYTGKAGKENGMLRLISLTGDDYRPDIANGFNIGAGSLVSPPSVNERATAGFEESESHMELHVELKI